MKENELDELFRSGVETNYPVDPALWTAVEPKLPAPNSGGGLWVFILNGIAIISVLFFGNYTIDDAKNLQANETSEVLAHNVFENTADEINPKGTLNYSTMRKTAVFTNNENIKENKVAAVQIRKENAPAQIELAKTNGEFENKDVTINGKLLVSAEENEPVTDILKEEQISKTIPSPASQKADFSLSSTKSSSITAERNKSNTAFILPLSLGLPLALNTEKMLKPLTINRSKDLFMPAKRVQFSQFELVYSRSFYTKKSVSGLSEKAVDLKANAERNSEVTTIGLNLINHYKWLTYGIGVHYFKQSERVKYDIVDGEIRDVITYDTTYNVLNTNYTSNGHVVLLIQNQINQISTPTYVEFGNSLIGTNTFERIQVPVFVGVNKRINNWSAELRTGLVANYGLRQSGAYINEDLNGLVDFSDQAFFNDLVLGQTNNLSIGYQINESFSIGGRLNYEVDLTSITKDYSSKLQTARGGVWILFRPK